MNCSNNPTAQFFTFHGFAFICIISLYLHNNSPQGSKQQQCFTGAESKIQRGSLPKWPQCKFCVSASKTHVLLLNYALSFLGTLQLWDRIKAPTDVSHTHSVALPASVKAVLVKCENCSQNSLFHPIKKTMFINNHSVKLAELTDKVGQL